jgi:hypothetical protein
VSGAVDRLCDRRRIELQEFAQAPGFQAIRAQSELTQMKYVDDIELASMTEWHGRILLLAGRVGKSGTIFRQRVSWSFRPGPLGLVAGGEDEQLCAARKPVSKKYVRP